MRIGLASDSFGNLDPLEKALELFARAQVDRVYFLGGTLGDLDAVLARRRRPREAAVPRTDAEFLAAVQIIVYSGAIVVLFLFVIMLLGVDREENVDAEPLKGQRPAAAVIGAVLGVINTVTALHAHRVRMRVIPKIAIMRGGHAWISREPSTC